MGRGGWARVGAAVVAALCASASWAGQDGQALVVAACGDVMMQDVDGGKRLGDAQLMSFMDQAAPWFKSAQVGFANLEGPVGGGEPKACSGEHCYRFRQGPLTPRALAKAGVNALSLANNHANDMGAGGQAATRAALDEVGARYAGHFAAPSVRWEQGGVTVELLAMTANGFAPDFRKPSAYEAIAKAKARSDIVIVSAHMGCEGERCARLMGGRELFLGEDRGDPEEFGRKAVDAGADLVIGSGPHVPRGLALRKGRLIAYSLGNCAAGPGISTAGKAGLAPVLRARLARDGRLLGWDVGSFVGDGTRMAWDPKEGALSWMLEATRLDSGPEQAAELMELRDLNEELRRAAGAAAR